jgi:hypothetical protein
MLGIGEIYHGSVYRVTRVSRDVVHLTDTGMVSAYDKQRYEHIPGLAEVRTAQTVAAMSYLRDKAERVAFIGQVDDATISAEYGVMIRGEWVTRARLLGSWQERHPGVPEGAYPDGLGCELFSKLALDMRNPAKPRLVDGNSVRKGLGIYMDPYLETLPGRWLVHDAHDELRPGVGLHDIRPLLNQRKLDAAWRTVTTAFETFKRGIESIDCSKVGIPGLEVLELADWKVELTEDLAIGDVVNLDTMRLLINRRLEKKYHLSKQRFRDGDSKEETLEVYKLGLRAFRQLVA